MSLDDFPARDNNSELAVLAESKFEQSVVDAGQFVVQQRDRRDYGTDFQIEATQSGGMTNYRVYAQLKGTHRAANRDGSISISVDRTNLNYMLSQANSIYVCYHAATDRLLVRSAEDVFRDAEHQGEGWRSQDTLTIRFHVPFDSDFQATLRARSVAASASLRDERLHWVATPPKIFAQEVRTHIPAIYVPESREDAFDVLQELYARGADEVISRAFEQFSACFGNDDDRLAPAYLSEINLAMRHQTFERTRVIDGIKFLETVQAFDHPSTTYCRANGHFALDEKDEAKRLYREAICQLNGGDPDLESMCWKNLGSVVELQGDHAEARRCYEQALKLAPHLMEAHFAFALSHRDSGELQAALRHFDQVVWASDDVAPTIAARGHRLEVYFRLGLTEKAFDEITVIMPYGDLHQWVLPWCARLVYNFARTNAGSVPKAIRFWDAFLRKQPEDRAAKKERLLCLAYAKMHGQNVAISFQQYVPQVAALLAKDPTDAAYLWDRVGHWAQVDGDWEQAEAAYRKAYSMEPGRYGYCLGTALNLLGRHRESLPILLEQATVHQPDAMSWFQLALAKEGTSDIEGCKESYRRALTLDPDYDAALFNFGGICWNYGPKDEAVRVWADAMKRFPAHPMAEKIRREFSQIFGQNDGE